MHMHMWNFIVNFSPITLINQKQKITELNSEVKKNGYLQKQPAVP